ncbi:unnamed protein product [Linum tenue]|uniref:Uncharacterized protein n=1 Tax=Linum tenue TaxID=586396 RepID=A0AAV0PU40_9ROSI|nr:unnamed protein product [Linum tenue]
MRRNPVWVVTFEGNGWSSWGWWEAHQKDQKSHESALMVWSSHPKSLPPPVESAFVVETALEPSLPGPLPSGDGVPSWRVFLPAGDPLSLVEEERQYFWVIFFSGTADNHHQSSLEGLITLSKESKKERVEGRAQYLADDSDRTAAAGGEFLSLLLQKIQGTESYTKESDPTLANRAQQNRKISRKSLLAHPTQLLPQPPTLNVDAATPADQLRTGDIGDGICKKFRRFSTALQYAAVFLPEGIILTIKFTTSFVFAKTFRFNK